MSRRWRVLVWLVVVLVWGFLPAWAQGGQRSQTTDQRLEHVNMLVREVQWATLKRRSKFFIEYLGTPSAFSAEFTHYFQTHKVRGKSVQVTMTPNWDTRNRVVYPDLIFVSASASQYMPQVYKFFEGYPVLVVSETPYYGAGWMVSLVPQGYDEHGAVKKWAVNVEGANIITNAGLSVSAKFAPKKQQDTPAVAANRETTSQGRRQRHEPEDVVVDYPALVSEQRQTIVAQERTIGLLRDTILIQRGTIDSLRAFAYTKMYSSAQGLLRKGIFNADAQASHLQDSLLRREVSVSFAASNTVNTAPWKGRAFGYAVLLSLMMVSLVSVMILSLVGGGSGASAFASQRTLDDSMIALGGVAVAGTERREEGLEETFLGNVSHELRTPLNAIVGLSQYVASVENVDSDVRESLEIINSNAHGLMQMMNSILTLSLLQRKEMVLNIQQVDLSHLFANINRSVQSQLVAAKRDVVELSYVMDGFGVQDAPIYADAEKLGMVLELLLSLCILTPRWQAVEFGCVHTASLPIFYVRGVENVALLEKLSESDFSFSAVQHYRPSQAGRDISLDTVSGLIDLMGGELYVDSDSLKQLYYFCVVEDGERDALPSFD